MERNNFDRVKKSEVESSKETAKARFLKYLRRSVLLCGLSYGAFTAKQHMDIDDYSQYEMFNQAFGKARHDGEKKFEWKGKTYTTELVDKEVSDIYFESKDFLHQYYSSDYFKNKLVGLRDTVNIYFDSYEAQSQSHAISSLSKKFHSDTGLSDAEFDEYMSQGNNLYDKFRTIDSYTATHEFSQKIESLKDSLASVYKKNLDRESYFSITDRKGKDSPDGFYNRANKHLFIHQDNPEDTEDITTSVHELTHKSSDGDSMLIYTNDFYTTILDRYLQSLNKMSERQDYSTLLKYKDEIIDYLSSPTEIDARQNSTRFWLYKNFEGYTPDTVFTGEHFDFLVKNYDSLPPDIRQLLDIFPERDFFVDNMNLF